MTKDSYVQDSSNDSNKEVWQRQLDFLKQIGEAETEYFNGVKLQNPLYDQNYGNRRVVLSLTTMLSGCELLLQRTTPLLKDNKGLGMHSQKFEVYQDALNQATTIINGANVVGINSPQSYKNLKDAATIIKTVFLALQSDIHAAGINFRLKADVDEDF